MSPRSRPSVRSSRTCRSHATSSSPSSSRPRPSRSRSSPGSDPALDERHPSPGRNLRPTVEVREPGLRAVPERFVPNRGEVHPAVQARGSRTRVREEDRHARVRRRPAVPLLRRLRSDLERLDALRDGPEGDLRRAAVRRLHRVDPRGLLSRRRARQAHRGKDLLVRACVLLDEGFEPRLDSGLPVLEGPEVDLDPLVALLVPRESRDHPAQGDGQRAREGRDAPAPGRRRGGGNGVEERPDGPVPHSHTLASRTWSRENPRRLKCAAAPSISASRGTSPTISLSAIETPAACAFSRIASKTWRSDVVRTSSMFMETCTRPRSARANPFARTARNPPSRSRISRAIRFATSTSVVRRFTFQATRTGRAPTITAPAVGWSRRGPKSGARSGCVPISALRPSYSPRRTSGRAFRSGRVAAASYRYTGTPSSSAIRFPTVRARATQSSIVTPAIGTNGRTSRADRKS